MWLKNGLCSRLWGRALEWSVRLDGNTNRFSGQVIQNGAILYSDANLFSGWFTAELWTPSGMAL